LTIRQAFTEFLSFYRRFCLTQIGKKIIKMKESRDFDRVISCKHQLSLRNCNVLVKNISADLLGNNCLPRIVLCFIMNVDMLLLQSNKTFLSAEPFSSPFIVFADFSS